jgi:hypothetical protein
MALRLLPDLTFPITSKQCDGLIDLVVQLNILDAGLTERDQKALDIVLETYELKAETGGVIDFTGEVGQQALFQAAMNFCGTGNPIITRHGDLRAAHLGINYHNAQVKLKKAGMPALSNIVNDLLILGRKIAVFPPQTEDRMALLLSYMQKKKEV